MVCSTGLNASAAVFLEESQFLYFAECKNDKCGIFQLGGLAIDSQLKNTLNVEGEVIDIGYHTNTGSLIVLVKEYKGYAGSLGRALSKVGHGREKYDLFVYKTKVKSNVTTKHLVGEDIVNPTFRIEQSWLQ